MTDNQKKFADEYLIGCNATRAYKVAYPHVKSEGAAMSGASRLLRNVKVKTYIDEQLEKISSEKIADTQEVLKYLTSVMRGETTEEVVIVEGYGDGCSSARKVEKDVGAKDRLKAAELLGKRYGLFTDKVNVEGSAKVVIVDDLEA